MVPSLTVCILVSLRILIGFYLPARTSLQKKGSPLRFGSSIIVPAIPSAQVRETDRRGFRAADLRPGLTLLTRGRTINSWSGETVHIDDLGLMREICCASCTHMDARVRTVEFQGIEVEIQVTVTSGLPAFTRRLPDKAVAGPRERVRSAPKCALGFSLPRRD